MKGEATMNEGQLKILGRRARRCSRWRWLPGMLTLTGYHVSDEDAETDAPTLFDDGLPDLRDPATVGCLLALVRDAWPKAPANTNYHGMYDPGRGHYHRWVVSYCTGKDWKQAHGDTEAEALVAALEVAGKQEVEDA
jgi:hypothetical protein